MMPRYVVEVEGEGGPERLEVRAPSAMAARGVVERDGYRFVGLEMVGSSARRDRAESWVGLGMGVVLTVFLLPIMAVLVWLFF